MSELKEASGGQGFLMDADSFLGQELLDAKQDSEVEGEKYLTFHLKQTAYGVPITRIKEIIEYGGITRIPMTPPCIRGVLNLRGNVVPIINLGERLEIGGSDVSRKSCIIIVEVSDDDETMDLGFVVDGVERVISIADDHVEAAPAFGAAIKSDFIFGMGNVDDNFVTLLDLDTVLSVSALGDLVAAVVD